MMAFEMPGFDQSPANTASQSVKVLAQSMALVQPLQGASRDTELEDKLGLVQTQLLVVFSTADKVVPPAVGRTYRERMPNYHFMMVYDAGHIVATDSPEALSNTIANFLELHETFIVSHRDGRINP
jgi:pimeloyl-ACP methyl ester carboxylesterase